MPEMTKSDDLHQLEDGTGEVGFYRKFVTCCIGEKKPDKMKKKKRSIVR